MQVLAQVPGGGVCNSCASMGQGARNAMRRGKQIPMECRDCGGKGTRQLQVGNVVGESTSCGTCWGAGTLALCPECRGRGLLNGAVRCPACIFGLVAPEPHTAAFVKQVKAHNAKLADLQRQAREARAAAVSAKSSPTP